ncbi:VWA domain-containing protein [Actinomadura kijaniata]|uniref:VWFA domain-containing protein n=1 Tax=Actinomadura namibiensis TaxID=182080 RepID=A0A7W3QKQ9_ACTNM|nr:VWA domain-containing protein [Actinomadura namibiensis]MBA8950188.1 hypothetical protein [Actinomadura namibiensis]
MSDLPEPTAPDFDIEIDQNPYLPAGGREMHAIVTVRATGPRVRAPADAAEVVIVDTSGSMSYSGKIAAARKAAAAALGELRDGVRFAVVAGANEPRMIYPPDERLTRMDAGSRKAALAAVKKLEAAGGTAIGSWLRLAGRLLAEQGAIRHAILLTDGKNQHESAAQLDQALKECEGGFTCDAFGVGTDWEVAELRKISSALLGTFLDVSHPDDLQAHFREMAGRAMDKTVGDVALRVWTPQNATIRFLKQMEPVVEDLTDRRAVSGPQTGDYPIGAWGDEDRDYHLCVEVQPGDVGRQMRAAWVRLVVPDPDGGERLVGPANVLAEWTDDEAKSTRISRRVAHHTGQSELAEAVQSGLEARRRGDEETATARLGRAVVLARQVGNRQISELLEQVVDIVDEESGTVRLKRDVDKAAEMSLDTRSVRTVRTGGRRPPSTGS